ncbi:MAG: hypothetical protein QOJ38_654 [Solirubrobacterales bacterium]|jgi:uncharacterized protein (UPF0332 family)/predicted nucleotidyltransferase|nr:hypothetical protein [Solirubrobacterales bacterium]
MLTLATTSLREVERERLETFVELLKRDLGDRLLAVWLYGSRARGEAPGGEDSDVDLLVLTEDASRDRKRVGDLAWQAGDGSRRGTVELSPTVGDLDWLAERRSIEAFFIKEVDRDKVVLFGDSFDAVGLDVPPPSIEPGRMSPRSQEYFDMARSRLRTARMVFEDDDYPVTISLAYYSMLYAARAALSEEDLFAKTHTGVWNVLRTALVEAGRFPAELQEAGQGAQQLRWDADYAARDFSREQAEALLRSAERFLEAVETLAAG